MESPSDDKLEILIHAMWKCKNPFTKEELAVELEKLGFIINDFDGILLLCKDFLFKEGDKYRKDISKLPLKW